MTRYLTSPLRLLLVFLLVASTAMAQSESEGWALYNQASKLKNEATSKDDLMKAQEKFEEALRIFRQTNSEKGTAYSWYQMGLINSSQGQHAKALEDYEKSLETMRKLGDVRSEGATLINIGGAYDSLGQYQKALEYYEKSLEICRQVGDVRGKGVALNNIGLVYKSWGQYEKALEYYEKSLEIYRQVGDVREEGTTLGNIGEVYIKWGQYQKALEYYEKSLEIRRRIGDVSGEGITQGNIGKIYSSLGQYQKALEHFEQSLKIFRPIGDVRSEGICLNDIGHVYSSWGQYQKALEHFEQSLKITKNIGDVKGEATTLDGIASVYDSWGQYQKALEYYEKSLEISRRIGDVSGEGTTLNNIGLVYIAWGQYQKALEYYEKSLGVTRRIGDVKQEGTTLSNIGIVYRSWGQYQKALEYYEKSLEIRRRIGDVSGEMTTLNNIGMVYVFWGQYANALEYYEKSLEITRKLGDLKGEGVTLNNIAGVYSSWGQYQKALEYYEKSLEIGRRIGDASGEGTTLANIAGVYESWGQYQKALEYYEKSLEISRRIGDASSEGTTLNNIGLVYSSWGQYQKALEYLKKSLEIRRRIGDVSGEGVTMNNIGTVYDSWGQYQKALECYEKSLEISRRIGDASGEGVTLNNFGSVHKSWGQYQNALEYYEKSLEISRRIGDASREGTTLSNIGLAYAAWGDYQKALEYYEKSLEIRKRIGDVNGEGDTLSNIGGVHAALGKYEEALADFEKVLDVYTRIGVPADSAKDDIGNLYLDMGRINEAELLILEAGYDVSLGRLHLLKADYSKAADYYQKVRQRSEKNRNSDMLFASYTGLGMACERLGDDKGAEDNYHKAVDLTEEVRSSLNRDQREKFFDVKVKGFLRTDPYDGLARVRLRMGKKGEALKVSEYTKARIFAESMSRRSGSNNFDIPPEVKKEDEDLNNKLSALKKTRQEAYEKGNKLVIEAIEPQVKGLEANLQAHVKMLRETYPLFAATKYPEPMDLEQTALNDNEWVLEYHVTDPGIILYLSKGKQLVKALFKPKTRNDLEKLVLEYRKPLEIQGKDKPEEKLASFNLPAGKELADLLLSDVLDLVPKGASIIVVPDDCLGTVPFEMLTLNDKGSVKTDRALPYVSGAEFFGDRNITSYYQSVTALTLARTHTKGKAAAAGLLVIADPVFSEKDERVSKAPKKDAPTGVFASLLKSLHLMGAGGSDQIGRLSFSRLEFTNELAESLVQMDKSGTHVCKGLDATRDNFLQNIKPSLKKYDKIVFATHGYFGKDLSPIMEPVLVLTLVPPGTDGFLRMTEVMGLDMNAGIVALTACQTGLGTKVSGEGTMGMGRAFQYAGAKSVLMSLWSVSEVASVKLVKSFFQHIKAGKSKPQALELARGELRKGVWDHPFFWAGFILVGEVN